MGKRPTPPVRELADLFRCLADEHRLTILFLLAEHSELSVSALGERLGQSQPAVSHHLTQLRQAGLIDYRRDGKFNRYALTPGGLHRLLGRAFPDGLPARLVLAGIEIRLKPV